MIVDCQAAVCSANDNPRFAISRVALGKSSSTEFYLVVNQASSCRKFLLNSQNARFFNSSLQFSSPRKIVHLRGYEEQKFKQFKALVHHILNKNFRSVTSVARVQRVSNLKPKPEELSLVSTSKLDKSTQWDNLRKFSVQNLKIPKEIFTENNVLTHLTLVECSLYSIPPPIVNLKKTLRYLNLSSNNIRLIPAWFCRLFKSLKHLDLSRNALTFVPFELCTFKECQSLFLQNNRITHIHSHFLSLILSSESPFNIINLSKNHLKTLNISQGAFSKRRRTEIDLAHNEFDSTNPESSIDYNNRDSLRNLTLVFIIEKFPKLLFSLSDPKKVPTDLWMNMQFKTSTCSSCSRFISASRERIEFSPPLSSWALSETYDNLPHTSEISKLRVHTFTCGCSSRNV